VAPVQGHAAAAGGSHHPNLGQPPEAMAPPGPPISSSGQPQGVSVLRDATKCRSGGPAMAAAGPTRQIHARAAPSTGAGQSQCSFLFDVSAKTYVAISAVSFVPGTDEGDYEIWSAPDMHERVHQTQKSWTLVAKGTQPRQVTCIVVTSRARQVGTCHMVEFGR